MHSGLKSCHRTQQVSFSSGQVFHSENYEDCLSIEWRRCCTIRGCIVIVDAVLFNSDGKCFSNLVAFPDSTLRLERHSSGDSLSSARRVNPRAVVSHVALAQFVIMAGSYCAHPVVSQLLLRGHDLPLLTKRNFADFASSLFLSGCPFHSREQTSTWIIDPRKYNSK